MLLVLLVVVVAVRCRKLIRMLSWIIGGLFGLFIGSVRRLPAEANQYTVVDYWRACSAEPALLLACSCLVLGANLWGAGETVFSS